MKSNKICDALFFISYFLLMFSDMFSNVLFCRPLLNLSSTLAIVLLLLIFFIQSTKYKTSIFLSIIAFLVLTFLINIGETQKNIIYICLLIISFKNVDYDRFMKKVFIARILFLVLILLSSFLGLTQDYNMYRNDGSIRYSLGFAHPNRLAACVVELILEYLYIKREKISIFSIVVMVVINLLILKITDSRSAYAVIFILAIVLLFHKIFKGKILNKKIVKNGVLLLPIIFSVGSIFVSNLYLQGNEFLKDLNKSTTGRIYLMAKAYKSGGITLFGRDVDAVDNSYIQMLSKDGVVFLTVFIVFYIKLMKKYYKEGKNILIIILMIYLVYGIVESYLFRITYNSFLIGFGLLVYSKEKEGET